jgi:TIR domain-containing protein
MPVFISHRTADDALARTVHYRLQQIYGIKCYIDDVDRAAQSADEKAITSLIVSRLTACTTLLAIMTENTRGSWWVPFEVGVARQAPRMIATFTNLQRAHLPEYLTEWPVLRGDQAIDMFVRYYKQQQTSAQRFLLDQRGASASASSIPDAFHRDLKSALGQ